MDAITLPDWAYAYGGPGAQGLIRSLPEDFIVQEELAFTPSGAGEHVLLNVQKISENTEYIARLIARFAGVRQRDVSFAGLKDRHAITSQWFSVWLPGKADPDWSGLDTPNLKILHSSRHQKKLKRGVLAANHFTLRIRDWQGDVPKLEQQLSAIQQHGIPNYFGEQRFGHHGQNINNALALFAGAKVKREQRSIYLSAARSYLFNHILSSRVAEQSWCSGLAGDVFMLEQSHSYFLAETLDSDLHARLQAKDLHPTGSLWGLGTPATRGVALEIEQRVAQHFSALAQGLEQEQLEQDRRALRVNVADLHWQFADAHTLELRFSLPAGSYATALLREILHGH